MHPFPHLYKTSASAQPEGTVAVTSPGLPDLAIGAPTEFDGPGDLWSPETLITAAVTNCFVLSFRAVATASRFEWTALNCHTEGTLERVERISRFTNFKVMAELHLPADGNTEQAERLLQKTKQICIISNSLAGETTLETKVVVG
jgi:organic hydroperoxide reductase OsmC/OhrA